MPVFLVLETLYIKGNLELLLKKITYKFTSLFKCIKKSKKSGCSKKKYRKRGTFEFEVNDENLEFMKNLV